MNQKVSSLTVNHAEIYVFSLFRKSCKMEKQKKL